ncbi:unnamed protein product [Didymodactylos carnosus]|uniref:Major facilitator superfamily (MFS) profile domain-containing protein n=1 Tax=Didymodactylos carnosus TaxID=1234261 RepID=A0A8S2KTE7_9BILA|nr:unnamed protein product [Didymodactylos carnosus]CAF3865436.1 unnamed protein product [Didymodactylos carnosus]
MIREKFKVKVAYSSACTMIKKGDNIQVYLTCAFASIGGFLFGYDTGVISGILTMNDFLKYFGGTHALQRQQLDSSISGAIVGILIAGCFIGALCGGPAGDRFSRKYSIVISCWIFIIGAILQTASVHIAMLLISRFVAGVGIGALSMLIPVYQSEIAPKEIRGRLVSLQQWLITIGIAVSFWINYGTDSHLSGSSVSWRLPLGLQIIPALILAFGIFFFPFSPRWLLDHDRDEDAIKVLARIRAKGDKSDPIVQAEYLEIKEEIALERAESVRSYLELFKYPLRRRLVLGLFSQIFQQFTGINSVMYYAPAIFKQAGLGSNSASLLATGINGCVNILATIPAILWVDKLGRRLLLISGAFVTAVSMLVVGGVMGAHGHKIVDSYGAVGIALDSQSAKYVIIVFVYVFVAGFAYSWGPTTWIYCTEIFPLSMRAKGTSLTTAGNWGANMIVSFIVPVMMERITYETKNKRLEDIDEVFNTSSVIVAFGKSKGGKIKPYAKQDVLDGNVVELAAGRRRTTPQPLKSASEIAFDSLPPDYSSGDSEPRTPLDFPRTSIASNHNQRVSVKRPKPSPDVSRASLTVLQTRADAARKSITDEINESVKF